MPGMNFNQRVEAVRRFNRFYTRQMGALCEGLLDSPFSLTEVRVLHELAHHEKPTATDLIRGLDLDAGYLSRMLRGFRKRGLIERRRSKADGRQSHVGLTKRGTAAFAPLDARACEDVGAMLRGLSGVDQDRLIDAMGVIETLLGASHEPAAPYVLRPHRPGDMGWVVYRHGVLYSQEYGWDERFEALVAGIVGQFIEHYDPKRERCWIAEQDGERIGSVFLVKKSKTVAKLRLLLVEPQARGLGLGRRLVDECVNFARQAGYRKVALWTNVELLAARHIYEKTGFRMIRREPDPSLGPNWIGETWALTL